MPRLDLLTQVFIDDGSELDPREAKNRFVSQDDRLSQKKAKHILFQDKGQNWEGCKCHPREIVIIKGEDTPEMKQKICLSIRLGQGYSLEKANERMIMT